MVQRRLVWLVGKAAYQLALPVKTELIKLVAANMESADATVKLTAAVTFGEIMDGTEEDDDEGAAGKWVADTTGELVVHSIFELLEEIASLDAKLGLLRTVTVFLERSDVAGARQRIAAKVASGAPPFEGLVSWTRMKGFSSSIVE